MRHLQRASVPSIVRVIDQPTAGVGQRLGDRLDLLLKVTPPFSATKWAVAFARFSGLGRLVPAIRAFRQAGGQIEVAVGVDVLGTSREALDVLLAETDRTYIFNNPGTGSTNPTFHTKLYLFERADADAVAIIGSHNLTGGGLYTNYETSIQLDLALGNPAQAQVYQDLLGVFRHATNVPAGNARILDAQLILALDQAGRLDHEVATGAVKRQARQQAAAATGQVRMVSGQPQPPLFRGVAVPPAPPMPIPWPAAAPAPTVLPAAAPALAAPLAAPAVVPQPLSTFVMTLGPRDTRQQRGFSRDVFIPKGARDNQPGFWRWPTVYAPPAKKTKGTYLERWVDLVISPVGGTPTLQTHVRLYAYGQRGEFRLNCGPLVRGASFGDVLVVELPTQGPLFQGNHYDYEATIVPATHPLHPGFVRACTNPVDRSPKRWGYL
jgi:hypothetical protein